MCVADRMPATSKEAYGFYNWIGPRCGRFHSSSEPHQGSFGNERGHLSGWVLDRLLLHYRVWRFVCTPAQKVQPKGPNSFSVH